MIVSVKEIVIKLRLRCQELSQYKTSSKPDLLIYPFHKPLRIHSHLSSKLLQTLYIRVRLREQRSLRLYECGDRLKSDDGKLKRHVEENRDHIRWGVEFHL